MRTQTFTIPRVVFARLSAELYVRRFWFLILPWPLFAVGLILLSRDPNIVFLAILVGIWPLTLPLRAFFFTSKTAKLFEKPTYMSTDAEFVYFHSEQGPGLRVAKERITGAFEMHGYEALIIGHMQFAFIPSAALEKGDARELQSLLATD